ncbi:MAG TPA: matrixin family metalloprotease [Drouetiella sp.]|jgi:predicted Zn-dependent protease
MSANKFRLLTVSLLMALWLGSAAGRSVSAQGTAQSQYFPVSSYLPSLDVTPPHFLRIEPDGVQNNSDFFDQVMLATSNRIFRFNSMPIPVFIDPAPADYVGAVEKALQTWETRTNAMIRFVRTSDRQKARITVIWSHLGIPTDRSATEFGAHTITEWKVKTGTFASQKTGTVKPQFIEVNLDVIEPRDADHKVPLLQNLVTHELGHALGLMGHSPERGDMMFRDTDEYSRISQRDLNTLQKIYSRKCDFPL